MNDWGLLLAFLDQAGIEYNCEEYYEDDLLMVRAFVDEQQVVFYFDREGRYAE